MVLRKNGDGAAEGGAVRHVAKRCEMARPRRGTGTGFEHTVPGKVTARQLRAAAAAQGDTVRRVAEHAEMDDTSDPSEDESEARGTSEVGSGTDEEDEREDASGGAHGGTA